MVLWPRAFTILQGLEAYSEYILPILHVAPDGLPNYSCLRNSLKMLDDTLELAKNGHKAVDDAFLLQACFRIKTMCQHV